MSSTAWRLAIFLSFFTLMFTAETLWPARPWLTARLKRFLFHVVLAVFNSVILRLLMMAPLFFVLNWSIEHECGLRYWLGLRGPWEVGLSFFLFDGVDYWWHRLNHRINFLWRFHQVHHMDTHVDLTTSLRFHPGELVLSGFMKMAWILVWGPSLWGFALAEISISFYSQFHHSNIELPERWEKYLRLVHMTPYLHAGHHTVDLRTRDANYSTVFLLWDRLFGTLKEPDVRELRHLGLKRGREQYLSFKRLAIEPFAKIVK